MKLKNRFVRSSTHFLKHPLATVRGLVFTPNRLRTFFTREHFEEPIGCQHPVINEAYVLKEVVGKTVLDVGCGSGRWGALLSGKGFNVVGVDVTLEYLALASQNGYTRLVKLDFEKDSLLSAFGLASFDTVLCVEVLEHLIKKTGLKLLGEMVWLGKKVVVTTPCGFYPFTGSCYADTHKSGWYREDFEALGYKVTVYKGRLYDYFLAVHDA
jgi:SAM-dependent methyltransferase